jgi:radical SAM-linked protein
MSDEYSIYAVNGSADVMEIVNLKEGVEEELSVRDGSTFGGKEIKYGRSVKRVKSLTSVSMKFRIKYSKSEVLRFTSHLEVVGIFSKVLRKSGLPIAYSNGVDPHPRMSFGPPLAMGYTSEAEYVDLEFSAKPNSDIKMALNSVMPDGICVIDFKVLWGKQISLSQAVNIAVYEITNLPRQLSENEIANFLNQESIVIERQKNPAKRDGAKGVYKNGVEEAVALDIRPFIHNLQGNGDKLHLILKFLEGRAARADEVLLKLFGISQKDTLDMRIHRSGLFIESEGVFKSPMDVA